jgi:hypothetical protein
MTRDQRTETRRLDVRPEHGLYPHAAHGARTLVVVAPQRQRALVARVRVATRLTRNPRVQTQRGTVLSHTFVPLVSSACICIASQRAFPRSFLEFWSTKTGRELGCGVFYHAPAAAPPCAPPCTRYSLVRHPPQPPPPPPPLLLPHSPPLSSPPPMVAARRRGRCSWAWRGRRASAAPV